MPSDAPLVDRRTAADVASQVTRLIDREVGAGVVDPKGGLAAALIDVFARFAEITIERLNRVPDRAFLAFLDLLGASRLPPQPARAPLTFTVAAASTADALVPAGTRVAAAPSAGAREPVIFETERDLVVTSATLAAAFVRDPAQDLYADRGALIGADGASPAVAALRGDRPVEHALYLAHDELLGFAGARPLVAATTGLDGVPLEWAAWSGAAWEPLGHDGGPGQVTLKLPGPVPRTFVNGRGNRWVRGRMATPISPGAATVNGMRSGGSLPQIGALTLSVTLTGRALPIEAAFANAVPVDPTKDFRPFGDTPALGDTLYLAQAAAFSQPAAKVTLHVTVSRAGAKTVKPDGKTEGSTLKWEAWTGASWTELTRIDDTTSDFTGATGTIAFSLPARPVPTTVHGIESAWVRVRIVTGGYGEAGHYEHRTEAKPGEPEYRFVPPTYAPPTIGPVTADYEVTRTEGPQIALAHNDFAWDDLTAGATTGAPRFSPFRDLHDPRAGNDPRRAADERAALYLGFALPPGRTRLPSQPLSLYVGVEDRKYGERSVPLFPVISRQPRQGDPHVVHAFTVTNPGPARATFHAACLGFQWPASVSTELVELAAGAHHAIEVSVTVPTTAAAGARDRGFLRLTSLDGASVFTADFITWVPLAGGEPPGDAHARMVCEYWNGTGWTPLTVRDGTDGFTRAGVVDVLPPDDFAPRADFGRPPLYWLRARPRSGGTDVELRLRRVALNTVMAAQALTIRDEILGGSDATAGLRYHAAYVPVLAGERLQVREAEAWIAWSEVTDFHGSVAGDRHYVLDRLTGEIRFGDGARGMVPPRGAQNVRLASYRTGGGAAGNVPAGAVVQLQTTVPFVDRVINHEPARGGADAERVEALMERAPRALRHRDRAVTAEDYEDLARLASPEVARARCVPLLDLEAVRLDPERKPEPGVVSVIVVPRSTEARPVPSTELLARVSDHLAARSVATRRLVVVGPEYIRVEVQAELAVTSLERAIGLEAAAQAALARFLHPLAGGSAGEGWPFGRAPHRSDLLALLQNLPGVDHVGDLTVTSTPEPAGTLPTERSLVYSGTHTVTLTFTEA